MLPPNAPAVSNQPPIATNLNYTGKESTALVVDSAAGVLSTASDPDGDVPLSALLAPGGSPTHGALTLSANGSFTYSPTPGYSGPDVFKFTVVDTRNGTVTRQANINVGEPMQIFAC
jgi:hypothetical protein